MQLVGKRADDARAEAAMRHVVVSQFSDAVITDA
jgi:hypothetical protein